MLLKACLVTVPTKLAQFEPLLDSFLLTFINCQPPGMYATPQESGIHEPDNTGQLGLLGNSHCSRCSPGSEASSQQDSLHCQAELAMNAANAFVVNSH